MYKKKILFQALLFCLLDQLEPFHLHFDVLCFLFTISLRACKVFSTVDEVDLFSEDQRGKTVEYPFTCLLPQKAVLLLQHMIHLHDQE